MNAVHADYFEKVVELCTELQPERVQQILQSCVDIHLQKVSIRLLVCCMAPRKKSEVILG